MIDKQTLIELADWQADHITDLYFANKLTSRQAIEQQQQLDNFLYIDCGVPKPTWRDLPRHDRAKVRTALGLS